VAALVVYRASRLPQVLSKLPAPFPPWEWGAQCQLAAPDASVRRRCGHARKAALEPAIFEVLSQRPPAIYDPSDQYNETYTMGRGASVAFALHHGIVRLPRAAGSPVLRALPLLPTMFAPATTPAGIHKHPRPWSARLPSRRAARSRKRRTENRASRRSARTRLGSAGAGALARGGNM